MHVFAYWSGMQVEQGFGTKVCLENPFVTLKNAGLFKSSDGS